MNGVRSTVWWNKAYIPNTLMRFLVRPDTFPSIALLKRSVETPAIAVATTARLNTKNEKASTRLVYEGVADEKLSRARKVLA